MMKNKKMIELKIKQEFLDDIKNGIKDFEIRKKDYGFKDWTKVKLVVKKWTCVSDDFITQKHIDIDLCSKLGQCSQIETIKETLVVELKQTEMTTFQIGCKLERKYNFWLEKMIKEDKENENERMLCNVINFLNDYLKDDDKAYWYDLRLVK